MRHLLPALVVTAACFSTSSAAPAKTSPFSNKSYGDGGGYKHPDAAVGQFFEAKPEKPAELKPERPQVPAKVTPEIRPIAAAPSRPRPRPFASTPAKAEAPGLSAAAQPGETAAPSRTERGGGTSSPDGSVATLDAASEDARRDYEARLFGAAPAPRRPELGGSPERSPIDPALSASTGEGMLFVSLELDPQEAGALRDAVAGLGAAAAFRPDARFQPLPGAGGSVRISGWLPATRLADAIARPGVRRVAVERGSRPAGDERVRGSYLLTLHVTDPARPEESVAESVRELSAETGYKLDRVVAIEAMAGGGKTALVSGTMPVSRLARALGLRGVVKIASAPPGSTPAAASDSSAAAGSVPVKKEGFLTFVMARSLWLVLLTALLVLPTFGRMILNGLAVFVPYR